MVKIDDYNAAHVSELREDLFALPHGPCCFEDEATKLKNNIKAKDAALRGSLTFFDSVCQESSTAVPLLTVAENLVRKSLLLPASQMLHRFSSGYHSPR